MQTDAALIDIRSYFFLQNYCFFSLLDRQMITFVEDSGAEAERRPLVDPGRLRLYETGFLMVTPYYKYMGLLFPTKLSWSSAKIKLAAQAKKTVFAIRKYQRPFGMFLHIYIFKLFDSMVKPILCYGLEV